MHTVCIMLSDYMRKNPTLRVMLHIILCLLFLCLQLTFVDFVWYEVLDLLNTIDPALLSDVSNLNSFRRRFQAGFSLMSSYDKHITVLAEGSSVY